MLSHIVNFLSGGGNGMELKYRLNKVGDKMVHCGTSCFIDR